MKYQRYVILVLTFVALTAGELFAQNPTITLLKGLSFGMTITGATNTIAPTDPQAAEVEVDFPGYGGWFDILSVTFTLPSALTSGGNSLTITFSTSSAARNTVNTVSGSTTFDPNGGYTFFVASNTPTTLYIWIGGSISPPNNQAAGDYLGNITVTATATTIFPTNTYRSSLDIPVDATIIRGLSLMSAGMLDFGLVVAGTTVPAISARSGTAPAITAAGAGGRSITVTYSSSTSLDDGSGNSLTFYPSLYGTNVYGDQAGATTVSSGAVVNMSGGRRTTGYYYFWLGGSLDPVPAGQPPGNYAGNFVLNVAY